MIILYNALRSLYRFLYRWLEYPFTLFYLLWNPSLISVRRNQSFAGPGFLDFGGGVFNPGAILWRDGIRVLAKAQVMHWYDAHTQKQWDLFFKGKPLLFHFNKEFSLQSVGPIGTVKDLPADPNLAVEDFRLFSFNDKLYVNHPLIICGPEDRSVQALSELDAEQGTLTYLGQPAPDFEVTLREKNWAYFAQRGHLYLLYSFSPYVLLRSVDWPGLRFATVLNLKMPSFFGRFSVLKKAPWSISSNPVDYDEDHWLMMVHVHTSNTTRKPFGRIYFQWAVLIEKKTFLPAKISAHPVFKGGLCRGTFSGTIYTTSAVVTGDDVVFFSGEGDSYACYVRIKKTELDQAFVKIDLKKYDRLNVGM